MKPINITATSINGLIEQFSAALIKVGGYAVKDIDNVTRVGIMAPPTPENRLPTVFDGNTEDEVIEIFEEVFDELGYDTEEFEVVEGVAFNIYKR